MKPKTIIITVTIIIIAIIGACTQNPSEPQNDNPFDPNNTATGGDPFQLQAQIANGGVTLTWNKPEASGLANFKIYRSEQQNSGYTALQQVGGSAVQYVDQTVENGHNYWYRVTALDNTGQETAMTNIAPVNINTDPVLVINGGDQYTTTKEVSLTILANTAQQMLLSNTADFSGAQWESYAAGKNWTLLTGEGQKTVYMKVKYNNGNESPVMNAVISPQPMNPSIMINNNDNDTSTRNVTLQLNAAAAIQMIIGNDSTFSSKTPVNNGNTIETQNNLKEKFNPKRLKRQSALKKELEKKDTKTNSFNSPINIRQVAENSWEPFTGTKTWTLTTGPGIKTVYARFKNDFEIESELVFDTILPQPINPAITIAGGAQYTPTRNVELTLSASGANLQMKISEDSTFAGLNWQTYSQTVNFNLSTGDGAKTVYARFKNDFEIESARVNNSIIVDTTPPIPVLIISPDSGITNETNFQFDPTQCSDNLTPLNDMQIRFDWQNDGAWDTNWQPAQLTNYTYIVGGGDKSVRMELQDGAGWSADTTGQIFVNTRPVAQFTATVDTGNYFKYSFDASASSDYEDGSNLQYRWDFDGDGNWETGWLAQDTISNVYAASGNYSPKLSVRDLNSLSSEYFLQITINPICTDIDGNIYQIVKIGNQWWMAENLKTTRYRNGDAIPNVTNGSTWSGLSTGAYCDYDNNVNNVATYGRLYNWYAVDDSRNIAPQGWHVPEDDEWKQLEMYLGMSQSQADDITWRGTDEGGKLKEAGFAHWNNPNTGATNSSGFTALPGGDRGSTGSFYDMSGSGYWWSATEYSATYSWYRGLGYSNAQVSRDGVNRRLGFSVRCVRD